ncbi:DUF4174 domain-containing protein [Pseudomonas sp. R5(2019)]|uniref:DUF4174 domain-containing protein n=1 Tax=Pseudomonas sp. R5(2019) TaxID=2697566 RepID=UPI0014131892|nr:DUF4174 domain-containing protein [Pseudomonas sp. R5(2019)]NBA93411.1 DUF4174 domain-containing protein [Pseudomonas sp. R5(2019)]
MFSRSLTFFTLLAIASPVLAADSDSPLAQERGRTRPLIVIAPSSVDPTLVQLKKSLEEPENRKGFNERKMVLFTVVNMIGQRDGKHLDPQTTMALIRELKLGASTGTKVILVGKDGEKKLEEIGSADIKKIFTTIDAMPMTEKEATAAAPAEPEAAAAEKPGKPAKPAKPLPPPKPLED